MGIYIFKKSKEIFVSNFRVFNLDFDGILMTKTNVIKIILSSK